MKNENYESTVAKPRWPRKSGGRVRIVENVFVCFFLTGLLMSSGMNEKEDSTV